MRYLILMSLMFVAGCTSTQVARVQAYGNKSHIVCYSGGTVIYDGHSTGRVHSPEGSDGWAFKDDKTGRLMEVSADCILEVEP